MNTLTTRATFKCNHMFPSLQSLKGCDLKEAWEKTYPHTLHELDLKSVMQTEAGEISQPIHGYKSIIRDDGAEIAVVRKSYTVVQPQTICDQFAPFVEAGLVELEAGGSLKGGTRMSIMAKIKGSDRAIAVGEEIAAFVNFYAGLDGSLGIGAGIYGVQARCLNGICTLKSKFNVTLRHTKTVHLRLSDAREAIAKAIQEFNRSSDLYSQLAKTKITRARQEAYVRKVLIPNEEQQEKSISTRSENKVNRVIELLDTQRGLELVPAVKGTAWQAYSAITEYLTHEAGRTEDSRLNSRMFGEGANLNRQALQLASVM